MKNKILFALLLSASVWIGCSKPNITSPGTITNSNPKTTPDTSDNDNGGDDGTNTPKTDIDCEGAICTMHFAEIELQIVDKANNPVVLDSLYTTDATGKKLPSQLYEYKKDVALYVVFNDAWVAGNQNTTNDVTFVGYKNGTKLVVEKYRVSTDCCHISMLSGNVRVVVP